MPALRLPVVTLCLCHIAHLYFVCNIFSYAGIMSVDLGWAADRNQAGDVAGFLQSANTLGRIPTASLWGFGADRFGYRPAVLCTLCSIILGGACFGLSTAFMMSVLSRAVLMGVGNGWITLMGPLCAKVGGPDHQMEVVSAVYGTGQFVQLIAPAIGGWTYGIPSNFPAALPSFIGICFGFIAIIFSWRWLPRLETVPCSAPLQRAERSGPPHGQSRFDWCAPSVAIILALRGLQGCLLFTMFDVVPLWAISERAKGGLALSVDQLGEVLAVSGAGNIVFSIFAMPRITKRFGLRQSFVVSCGVSAVTFVLIPLSGSWATMLLLHTVCSAALTITGAVAIVLTNNTVLPRQRGVVNGISTTFEALGKGLGPVTGAKVFSWSLKSFGSKGRFLIFDVLAALQVVCLVMTFCLSPRVEKDIEQDVCSPMAAVSERTSQDEALAGA